MKIFKKRIGRFYIYIEIKEKTNKYKYEIYAGMLTNEYYNLIKKRNIR